MKGVRRIYEFHCEYCHFDQVENTRDEAVHVAKTHNATDYHKMRRRIFKRMAAREGVKQCLAG